jgi:hypothetical protein
LNALDTKLMLCNLKKVNSIDNLNNREDFTHVLFNICTGQLIDIAFSRHQKQVQYMILG